MSRRLHCTAEGYELTQIHAGLGEVVSRCDCVNLTICQFKSDPRGERGTNTQHMPSDERCDVRGLTQCQTALLT